MVIPQIVGNFFLSLWIWHITYDLFHPVITALTMFLLLHFAMGRAWLRSLGVAISAQLAPLVVLTLIVPVLLIGSLNWQYEPLPIAHALGMDHIFMPSLMLGLFYVVAQALYFCIGRLFFNYNLPSYLLLIVISNGVGATLSFLFIRAIQFAYYVG